MRPMTARLCALFPRLDQGADSIDAARSGGSPRWTAPKRSRAWSFSPHRRCHRTTVGLWVWLTAWRETGTLGSVDLQEQRAEPRQRGQDAALLSVGNVAIGANQDGSIGLNLEEGMNCGAMAQRNVCL